MVQIIYPNHQIANQIRTTMTATTTSSCLKALHPDLTRMSIATIRTIYPCRKGHHQPRVHRSMLLPVHAARRCHPCHPCQAPCMVIHHFRQACLLNHSPTTVIPLPYLAKAWACLAIRCLLTRDHPLSRIWAGVRTTRTAQRGPVQAFRHKDRLSGPRISVAEDTGMVRLAGCPWCKILYRTSRLKHIRVTVWQEQLQICPSDQAAHRPTEQSPPAQQYRNPPPQLLAQARSLLLHSCAIYEKKRQHSCRAI